MARPTIKHLSSTWLSTPQLPLLPLTIPDSCPYPWRQNLNIKASVPNPGCFPVVCLSQSQGRYSLPAVLPHQPASVLQSKQAAKWHRNWHISLPNDKQKGDVTISQLECSIYSAWLFIMPQGHFAVLLGCAPCSCRKNSHPSEPWLAPVRTGFKQYGNGKKNTDALDYCQNGKMSPS